MLILSSFKSIEILVKYTLTNCASKELLLISDWPCWSTKLHQFLVPESVRSWKKKFSHKRTFISVQLIPVQWHRLMSTTQGLRSICVVPICKIPICYLLESQSPSITWGLYPATSFFFRPKFHVPRLSPARFLSDEIHCSVPKKNYTWL
jgi:hypothetical protein